MTSNVHYREVTDDLSVTVMPHIDGGYAWFVSVGDRDSSNDNLIYFRRIAGTVEEAFATAYCAIMGKTNVWKIKARVAMEALLHGKPGTIVWSNAAKYSYAVVYLHEGSYNGHIVVWSSDFLRSHMAESGEKSTLNEAVSWCVQEFFDNTWNA